MNINLLQKFYRGECSEEEAQQVIGWFSSGEKKEGGMDQLQAEWEQFNVPEDEVFTGYNPDKVFDGIQARIKEEAASGIHNKIRHLNINRFYSWRVASIVLLAVCVSFIMQILLQDSQMESSFLVVKEVPEGQRQTIILADGTQVTLNAGSKISYSDQFPENRREVTLEGEAFFDVARDEERPFMITTGEVLTTVLGTSFNVRAYRDEEDISVAVASGRVKVSKDQQACYLLPGKAAVYQPGEQTFVLKDYDAKEVLSWKEGIMYFKDASFEEVKTRLERWYGVEISTKGEGEQDWQYSGVFDRQNNLSSVLESIGYVKHFDYTLNGSQVELIFKKK